MVIGIEITPAGRMKAAGFAALVLIFGLGLVPTAWADCPHCYDIVKVRAEFRDGSVRSGYYEHHPSVVPIVEDSDGVQRIAFDQSSPNFPAVAQIRLIDTVYQFPRITNCTTRGHIDTVAVSSLHRLVYLGKVAYGGAGQLNVFSQRIVKLLGGTPVARFDTTYSLSEVVYLSYSKDATEDDLRHLGKILGRPGALDIRLRLLIKQIDDELSGSSNQKSLVDHSLATRIATLPSDQRAFEQYASTGPVGAYFKAIADNLRYRRQALLAVRLYLQTLDAGRLQGDLRQVCDSAKFTFSDSALLPKTDDPLTLVSQALRIVQESLSLDRTLGADYQEPLVDSGIVYVENPFD